VDKGEKQERRKKRIIYRSLDTRLYNELREWVKSYPLKKKRIETIIEEITGGMSQGLKYSGLVKEIAEKDIIERVRVGDKIEKKVITRKGEWTGNMTSVLLTPGGSCDNMARLLASDEAMKWAKERYHTLFEDVEAVEKAIEYIKDENKAWGLYPQDYVDRLAEAILLSFVGRDKLVENGGKSKIKIIWYTRIELIRKYKLGMDENAFTWQKRLFIGKLAELRGLTGLLEVWE
jgi:hypothetical protein